MGNRDLQAKGEDAAAAHLQGQGMEVVARNWRVKMGEIDIVARERDTLVFVEVKSRASCDWADPALSVGYDKQKRLRRLAAAYLVLERPGFEGCRFDVISYVDDAASPRLDHIIDAF